jgi:hypothetical protein
MRTLAITPNTTLDGAIEMLGDWFDPQGQGEADDLLEETHRQDAEADAFLCGRQTFTDLRGYLDGVQKYVVSSTLTDPEWQHTAVLTGDPSTGSRS